MFKIFRKGLSKTASGIAQAFTTKKLDDAALQELEDALILADVGTATALQLVEDLRTQKFDKDDQVTAAKQWLTEQVAQRLTPLEKPLSLGSPPELILFVGVNGAGKTTTIGKLAAQYKAQGKKVLLAAADTYRAGAVAQLSVWAERVGVPIVTPAREGADPAGVVYQALERAQQEKFDVVLADTAGRLQNRSDLMAQLEKIIRVIQKLDANAPAHVVQVLDATVGQNGLSQVKTFRELVGVTGLIITKLDGSAKAGVLLALAAEHPDLPVLYIGLGESVDDLQPFNAQEFAAGLVG